MVRSEAYFDSGYYAATLSHPSKKYKMVENIFKRNGIARVLDIGCGAGRHTYLLAKAGFKVYGCDISKKALEQNRATLKEHKVHAVLTRFDLNDDKWPYKDGFFDAVFASRVLYQSRIAGIIKNMAKVKKVLRDGGYLFWEGPTYKTSRKLFYDEMQKTVEKGTWVSIGGPYDGHEYHRFESKEEVESFLQGFKILRFDFRGPTFSVLAKKLPASNTNLHAHPTGLLGAMPNKANTSW